MYYILLLHVLNGLQRDNEDYLLYAHFHINDQMSSGNEIVVKDICQLALRRKYKVSVWAPIFQNR